MSRLTAVLELVELTMTVSPKRTMFPPIWVAACDSQRRRNPLLRKTASGPPSDGSGAVVATVTRSGRRRRSAPHSLRRSGRDRRG